MCFSTSVHLYPFVTQPCLSRRLQSYQFFSNEIRVQFQCYCNIHINLVGIRKKIDFIGLSVIIDYELAANLKPNIVIGLNLSTNTRKIALKSCKFVL